MEALRFKAKPVDRRIMIELPSDMDADTVEVIVLADKKTPFKRDKYRRPPTELEGTVIHDDLIAPAVSEGEWDALQ